MARVIATVWPGAAPAIAKIVERPRPIAFRSSVGVPAVPPTSATGGLVGSVGALIAVLLAAWIRNWRQLVAAGSAGRTCAIANRYIHDLSCQHRGFAGKESLWGDVEGVDVTAQNTHPRIPVPQSGDHLVATYARPFGVNCDAGARYRLTGFIGKVACCCQAR